MNPPAHGTPERKWWIAGARAEAALRDEPYKALPKSVHEVTDYIDAIVKHGQAYTETPGVLLTNLTYVFRSTLTKPEKRAIRRALRGKR